MWLSASKKDWLEDDESWRCPVTPVVLTSQDLKGSSLRLQFREQLRTEGVVLLRERRTERRTSQRSRRWFRRRLAYDRIAETAIALRGDKWEECDHPTGRVLAQDDNGYWCAPSLRNKEWFTVFNPLYPHHLAAWVGSLRTGNVVLVETSAS